MALNIETVTSGQHFCINRKAHNHCGSESLVVKQYNPDQHGFEYGWISSEGIVGEYQSLRFKTQEAAQRFVDTKLRDNDGPDTFEIIMTHYVNPNNGEVIDTTSNIMQIVLGGRTWYAENENFPLAGEDKDEFLLLAQDWHEDGYDRQFTSRAGAEQMLERARNQFNNWGCEFELRGFYAHDSAYVAKGRGSADVVQIPLADYNEDGYVNWRKFEAIQMRNLNKWDRLVETLPQYFDAESPEVPTTHRYRGFNFGN